MKPSKFFLMNEVLPEVVRIFNLDPSQEYTRLTIKMDRQRFVEIEAEVLPHKPCPPNGIPKPGDIIYVKGG